MDFTLVFIKVFFLGLAVAAPLLGFFILLISLLGLLVGRLENWSKFDAVYFSFVTATTVGYGDFRPLKKTSRLLAIIIAFMGLAFTGITVALAVNSAGVAFKQTQDVVAAKERLDQVISIPLVK
jgi:voltage-gated potassium channel